ncbi:hypothetical protein SEA_FRANSOYER_2 [Microbacterium phage Fransoyer]|nr:hypothetical protein SEA_RUBYRALPH_2 [Microbacterium phage RubyRalph]UUG69567.1 hypothetical protein SEA_FRANSOYER_2 [Microbacterium phage Fransoyer]
MSTVLEDEPLVLEQTDEATRCGFLLCERGATWSTIWTCGETIGYCDEHLRWAQRTQPVACACSDEFERPVIFIVLAVPL